MIRCKDGSLYTGWTNNLEKRFRNHCEGKGAKYTRGRGPLELVYYEVFEDKREAMRREYEIKQLKKCEKEKLIQKNK
jgi:putative endonuclease